MGFVQRARREKKLSLSTCENWHKKVCEATGVSCVIYDMRHTFATRFAGSGKSLATLAQILGHSSLRSVMKYVHPSQADQDRAMLELDGDPRVTQVSPEPEKLAKTNRLP